MRIIGTDIHPSLARAAILEGRAITRQLCVELINEPLVAFARTLSLDESSSKSRARAPRLSASCVRT